MLAGLLFTCYLVAQGLLIGAGLAAGRELSDERATEQVAAMLMGRSRPLRRRSARRL